MAKNDTYSLVNYFDVWGNEFDGWIVNNQCIEFEDLHIADDASDEDILQYLVSIGFLTKDWKDISEVDDTGADLIEIRRKDDGMPICALIRNNP